MRYFSFIVVVLLYSSLVVCGQKSIDLKVDSLLQRLTLREKISQLIMIDVYSNQNGTYKKKIIGDIEEFNPGGVIFFQDSPTEEVKLTNMIQNASKIPAFVAMDAEWGVAMRLKKVISLPRFMTLAASADSSLIFNYGKIIGQQCRRLGIHINFAPSVDVNSNPVNPVINYRSLGENPLLVVKYARWFCKGMLSEGVLPVAKHFPGHGNTSQDSHHALPIVDDCFDVIDSVHVFPFKEMIKDNIWGIMVAHIFTSALDTTEKPASISYKVVTELLKNNLGYNGIVMTDALMMKGLTSKTVKQSAEVLALMAGVDMLIMPKSISETLDSVEMAVNDGRLSVSQIDNSVRKILKTKFQLNLFDKVEISEINVVDDLNKPEYVEIKKNIFDKAVTLVINDNNIVPLNGKNNPYSVVSFFVDEETAFHKEARKFAKINCYFIPDVDDKKQIDNVLSKIPENDTLIVCVHQMAYSNGKNYKLSDDLIDDIYRFLPNRKLVLCLMGNPYSYMLWNKSIHPSALVVAYEKDVCAEQSVAKSIFGSIPFSGILPVSINSEYKAGKGLKTQNNAVLYEEKAENICANISLLDSIDSIVNQAIKDSVFPGCQIMAVKDGAVFYNKSFGYHTYDSLRKVKKTDLYDLASVTKVLSTTIAVMKLYDMGLIDLKAPLSKYMLQAEGTAIGKVSVDKLLTHSSGLPGWIPFYQKLLLEGSLDPYWYSRTLNDDFLVQISDSIFIRKDFTDSVLERILNSKLRPEQGYKYSDLGFIVLKYMVEEIAGCDIESFLQESFYNSLGVDNMIFNPLLKFSKTEIVPTENDKLFRNCLVHGFVHDQNAAVLGGIAGHAGLFSNTWNIAVVLQMLMQNGFYGGVRYLKPETVKLFTSQYFDDNRRALGFDRSSNKKNGNACQETSNNSYGHSGFTGTYVWSDPDNKLIYIFLSNRVNPIAENPKLANQNIRTRIHSLLYKSLIKSEL